MKPTDEQLLALSGYIHNGREYVQFKVGFWEKVEAWTYLQKNPYISSKGMQFLEDCRRLFPDDPSLRNPWRAAHKCDQWCWYISPQPTETLEELARIQSLEEPRFFDPEVWHSTSNRYRTVARVPEGMTAIEALQEFAPEAYQELMERLESSAKYDWCRLHADKTSDCKQTLTEAEWHRFRRAGGHSV